MTSSCIMTYDRIAHITQLQLDMGLKEFKITDVNLNTLLIFLLNKKREFNVETKSNGLCIVTLTN